MLEKHQLLHKGEACCLDPEGGRRAQRPGAHPPIAALGELVDPSGEVAVGGQAHPLQKHQMSRVGAERLGAHPTAHTFAGENERGNGAPVEGGVAVCRRA